MERHQKYNFYEKFFFKFSNFTHQNENIDNPERITHIFNNYFSTIGEKTQAKVKHSHKKYTDYLTNENPDSFFLSPTNKEKIKFILASLDISKYVLNMLLGFKYA